MNLFVWCALYFLAGSFGWGLRFRKSNLVTYDDYGLLTFFVLFWPFFFFVWLLAIPFRLGQRIGRRWP